MSVKSCQSEKCIHYRTTVQNTSKYISLFNDLIISDSQKSLLLPVEKLILELSVTSPNEQVPTLLQEKKVVLAIHGKCKLLYFMCKMLLSKASGTTSSPYLSSTIAFWILVAYLGRILQVVAEVVVSSTLLSFCWYQFSLQQY